MIAHGRTLVLLSLPRFCVVCEGKRLVALAPVGAPELGAVTPCPHCAAPRPLPLFSTPEPPKRRTA